MGSKPGRKRIEKYRAARETLEHHRREIRGLKLKDLIPLLEPAFSDLTKPLPKKATRVILQATARWVLDETMAIVPWEILDIEQPDFLDQLDAQRPGLGTRICNRMTDVGFAISGILMQYGLQGLAEITELTVRLHHGKEVRRGRGRKAKRGWEEGPHDSPGTLREYLSVSSQPRKAHTDAIQKNIARWEQLARESSPRAERQRLRRYIRDTESGHTTGTGRQSDISTDWRKEMQRYFRTLGPRMKDLWAITNGLDSEDANEGSCEHIAPEVYLMTRFQEILLPVKIEPSFAESLIQTLPERRAPYRWLIGALANYYGTSSGTIRRILQTKG